MYKGVSKHSWKKIVQLLWAVVTYSVKNVEQRIEHDIDSAYGICIYYTFLNFPGDLMNTLEFKHIINLTVC